MSDSEQTHAAPEADPTAFPERAHDVERLAAISPALLSETTDPVLDAVTSTLSNELGGAAFVTVVLETIQFLKSGAGAPPALAASRATNRSDSFCQHVVEQDRTLVIEDTTSAPSVSPKRFVKTYDTGAYLGVPIRVGDHVVGALCSVHATPRVFRPSEAALIEALSPAVADRFSQLGETSSMFAPGDEPDVERCLDVLEALKAFLADIRPAIRALVLHVETATVDQLQAVTEMVDEIAPLHSMLRDGLDELRGALGGACEPALNEIERLVFELRPLARLAEGYLSGVVSPEDTLDCARLLDAAARAVGALEVSVHTLHRALNRLH